MTDVIIRVHKIQAITFCMNRRETIVTDMVWTAFIIQQYIPISPAYCAIVKIMYHVLSIQLSPFPLVDALPAEWIITGFCKQYVFVGKSFGYSFYIFPLISSIPYFIPVKADSPHIFCCLRII